MTKRLRTIGRSWIPAIEQWRECRQAQCQLVECILEGIRAAPGFCMGYSRRWKSILTRFIRSELRRVWRTLSPRYVATNGTLGFKRDTDVPRRRFIQSVARGPRRKSISIRSFEDHTIRTGRHLPDPAVESQSDLHPVLELKPAAGSYARNRSVGRVYRNGGHASPGSNTAQSIHLHCRKRGREWQVLP